MDPNSPFNAEELARAILKTDDITLEPVATPEWPAVDGQLYVKTLSGTERERYLKAIRRVSGSGKDQTMEIEVEGSTAQLVARTLCDQHGTLLFTEAHVEVLGKKSAKALERVMRAAARINGLGDDAEAAAKKDSPTPEPASSTV